jgi:hypothetical protein
MNKELLDELTTKADELFRAIEDEDAYDDVSQFQDDVSSYLDQLINFLESIGGRVKGLKYIKDVE